MTYYFYDLPLYDEQGRITGTQTLRYTKQQLLEEYWAPFYLKCLNKAEKSLEYVDASFEAFIEEWKLLHGAWEEEINEQDNVDKEGG